MTDRSRDADGFGAFFRQYAKSWVHAVATAALTGLGILTFVHRYFAVFAVAAYVLPPVALYLGNSTGAIGERTPVGGTDDPGDSSETAGGADPGWTTTVVPTGEALHDVVVAGDRGCAVGDGGGVFTDEPSADGGGWTAVLDDGPAMRSNALRGVDAAGNGAIWFAGDGGALGRIDPPTERHVDYSAPGGDTSTIVDVAAARTADGETVLLADGSGRVRRGRYRDGELAWDEPVTPGSGSSVAGIALLDRSEGFVCDTDQSVFQTSDGGRSFDRIGLDDVDGTLTDVAATDDGECAVVSDDGVVRRYDGTTWTTSSLDETGLRALAARDGYWLACSDSGAVHERGDGQCADETGWRRVVTPAAVPLHGCSLGASTAVAVGDEGTIVERAGAPR